MTAIDLTEAREVTEPLGDEPWFENTPVWGPFQQAWQRLTNRTTVDTDLFVTAAAGGPVLREP
jgi:hypothetical protein